MPLVIACSNNYYPARTGWPVSYRSSDWRAPVERCYLTTDKDTLKGFIKLLDRNYYPVIPNGTKWAAQSIVDIKIKDIRYMKLRDSLNGSIITTEYYRLDQNYLCRLIAKENNAAIYDDFLRSGGWKNKMFLVTPKAKVQLFTWMDLQLHLGVIRPLLIEFIKKRYHADSSAYQRKTKNELILYILDLENNKAFKESSADVK